MVTPNLGHELYYIIYDKRLFCAKTFLKRKKMKIEKEESQAALGEGRVLILMKKGRTQELLYKVF